MLQRIGGQPDLMNLSTLTGMVRQTIRQGIGMAPMFALMFICLTVSPVQQFMGQRNFVQADISPNIDPERPLPSPEQFARLCQNDVLQALEMSLLRYDREVAEYLCTMVKKERINGIDRPEETIRCAFRQKPFSVLMQWLKGQDKADASLFVEGENSEHVLIRPSGFKGTLVGYVERTTNDKEVLEASRYSVHEFGLERGSRRTLNAWRENQKQARFFVEYLGEKIIPEVGNRPCYVIKRTCNPPEEEGMTEITIMLDKETWLQVGSVLKCGERLIGSYYFKDIQLKPTFSPHQFRPETVKKPGLEKK